MRQPPIEPPPAPWRARLHEVIFEADTPAGKAFDLLLLCVIVLSIAAVMLESVAAVRAEFGRTLVALEWVFTLLFTLEYALRLISVRRPSRYAVSFFGVVDLLAIVPTYLSLMIPGAQSLIVIRALRLLRIFRVLKLTRYLNAAHVLGEAMRASWRKIVVFLLTVVTIVLIVGATMYLIEGGQSGFTSIPMAVYWAVVTMTTVGFGDIVPQTVAGRVLASALMITGYGIIAVPTGIVTAELTRARWSAVSTQACPACAAEGHHPDAHYCKYCGVEL